MDRKGCLFLSPGIADSEKGRDSVYFVLYRLIAADGRQVLWHGSSVLVWTRERRELEVEKAMGDAVREVSQTVRG